MVLAKIGCFQQRWHHETMENASWVMFEDGSIQEIWHGFLIYALVRVLQISCNCFFYFGIHCCESNDKKCEVCFFMQSIVTQFSTPIPFQIPSSFTQVFITQYSEPQLIPSFDFHSCISESYCCPLETRNTEIARLARIVSSLSVTNKEINS